jgi:hypothetical protein
VLLRTLRLLGIKTCEPTEELAGWLYASDELILDLFINKDDRVRAQTVCFVACKFDMSFVNTLFINWNGMLSALNKV